VAFSYRQDRPAESPLQLSAFLHLFVVLFVVADEVDRW
jgi:hypothetical protein